MRPRTPAALISLVSLGLLAAIPARADDVRGACREDGTCYMLRLERVQPVDENNLGRLLHVRARTWILHEGVEAQVKSQEGYAFCSARAPALVTVDGERVRATWLAPQAPAEAERSRSPYVLYFEACHGEGAAAAVDVPGTAGRLGYAVGRASRATEDVGEPQDVLDLAAAEAGTGRGRRPPPALYGWPGYAR